MRLQASSAEDGRSLRPARLAARDQRQVITQNEDDERYGHKQHAHPEAPVAMHPMPVWAGVLFTMVATISFVVVPVSCHFAFLCIVRFLNPSVGEISLHTGVARKTMVFELQRH